MFDRTTIGRLFYGFGIIAYGLQQIIVLYFRPQILPNFPSWAHTITILPILTGLAMITAGLIIGGVLKARVSLERKSLFIWDSTFCTHFS